MEYCPMKITVTLRTKSNLHLLVFALREARCVSSSVQFLHLDVTPPRDSYAWSYRELETVFSFE